MDTISLIKQYLPLCWFKKNPVELPRSTAFFKENLLVFFIVEYFMQVNMIDDPFEAFYEVGIQTLLSLLFIGFVLIINKNLYAYVQVATAVFNCGNVVSLFIVPVLIWLTVTNHPVSYVLCGLLLLWEYSLIAYILKQVLSINTLASLILATSYFLATYLVAFGIAQLI
ncbi:MAG: hypothetical protein ABL925_01440 [Methylococcales bacterium]